MRCPTLEQLPIPPKGKTGWPWTEESPQLSEAMFDGGSWPKISIVTPSYNQGQFIEETIRSILLQGYPDVELIIIDGNSTDNTIEVIEKYESWISFWVSENDKGQAHALNKGFQKATGVLIGWQNSDDYYGSGSFRAIVEAALLYPEADIFYGVSHLVQNGGRVLKTLCSETFDLDMCCENFPMFPFSNQSMFFRSRIFEVTGFLDETYQYGMDTEFFTRLIIDGMKFKFVSGLVGFYRVHGGAKTLTDKSESVFDAARVCMKVLKSEYATCELKKLAVTALQRLHCPVFRLANPKEYLAVVKSLLINHGFHSLSFDMAVRSVLAILGQGAMRFAQKVRRL